MAASPTQVIDDSHHLIASGLSPDRITVTGGTGSGGGDGSSNLFAAGFGSSSSVHVSRESNANASASASANGSYGHFVHRSRTTSDDASSKRPRRLSPVRRQVLRDSSPETSARRSSTFSEYSLNEARDIINPRPHVHGAQSLSGETSPLASLSLAIAIVPAVAGALFKNGSSVATDVILLGLSAIFLHWSVTQPWLWYHAAQEVRVREEAEMGAAIDDDDSDVDSPPIRAPVSKSTLEHVPEEEATKLASQTSDDVSGHGKTDRQQVAIQHLYRYERLALMSCFASPLLSAYLLHAIRTQLSRPSEGLVSNYNLTIFLMVSELRVFSHVIKLVRSRTLHLQRIVHRNPYGTPANSQVDGLLGRLERLEAMSLKEQTFVEQGTAFDVTKASITRDIRSTMQPELDALNRAVRRYEKKTTLLQVQIQSRFTDVHERLDDAMNLATAAVNDRQGRRSVFSWVMASSKTLLSFFTFGALLKLLTLPLRPFIALTSRKSQVPPTPPQTPRGHRNGKTTLPMRYLGERVSSRVMKR